MLVKLKPLVTQKWSPFAINHYGAYGMLEKKSGQSWNMIEKRNSHHRALKTKPSIIISEQLSGNEKRGLYKMFQLQFSGLLFNTQQIWPYSGFQIWRYLWQISGRLFQKSRTTVTKVPLTVFDLVLVQHCDSILQHLKVWEAWPSRKHRASQLCGDMILLWWSWSKARKMGLKQNKQR